MRRTLFCYPYRRRWFPTYGLAIILGFLYIFYRLEKRASEESKSGKDVLMPFPIEPIEYTDSDSSEDTDVEFAELSQSFSDWKTGFVNIMEEDPPDYLAELETPCWYEPLGPPPYYPYREAPEVEATLEHRYFNGVRRRLRCLPKAYIAGFPRCGTDGLFRTMNIHPMIVSGPRQTLYWSQKRAGGDPIRRFVDNFDQPALEIEKQSANESYCNMVLLEGSPDTVLWRHDLGTKSSSDADGEWNTDFNGRYISHVTPDAKIFIIMRQPTNRLYSEYIFKGGTSREDFHNRTLEALKVFEECLREMSHWECVTSDTVQNKLGEIYPLQNSVYLPFVQKWREVFPPQLLMCLRFEDYVKDPRVIMYDVFRFLGFDYLPDKLLEQIQGKEFESSAAKVPSMMSETRQMLDSFFQPFNMGLAKLLGDNRFLWLDKNYNIVVENKQH